MGADRRQARALVRRQLRLSQLIGFGGAIVLLGLIAPWLMTTNASQETVHNVQTALRALWPMLFAAAGIFRLVRWRLTGESHVGLVGAALVTFGALYAPTTALAPLMRVAGRELWLVPATRSVALVVFLVMLAWGLFAPPVNSALRPLRVLVVALTAAGAIVAGMLVLALQGHPLSLPDHGWFAVGLGFAVCFGVLGVAAFGRGIRQKNPSTVWMAIGLIVLAAAEVIQAAAFVQPATIVLYATCLRLVVGILAASNAATDLGLILSADGDQAVNLRDALRETERQLTAEECQQEERLHDARSVIAALKAASLTLDRYDERLDNAMKRRLRSSLVSELSRLEAVIAGRREEPLVAFRLDVALMPVLTAECENGLTINNQLGSISVSGRPLELATVVQNLLVNARKYAAGSVVRISANQVGSGVELLVEDRGAGVAPRDHARIFERGYRSVSHDGHEGNGLGLYLARRLMREQGGDIEVRQRPGGGTTFAVRIVASEERAATIENEIPEPGDKLPAPRVVFNPIAADLSAT